MLLCCVALKLPQRGVGVQLRTPVQGSQSLKTRCEGIVCLNDGLTKKSNGLKFETIELKSSRIWGSHQLGGGFKHFLFSPLLGEDSHFD